MEEILPGVFHWTAIHPNTRSAASSYLVEGSGTAIDPLLPDDGIEWFESHPLQRVVLTNRHHLRHADFLAGHFSCPILCNEAGLHEFEGGPEVEGFVPEHRLAVDVTALPMDAICPDDTVLHIDAAEGALAFADSLVRHGEIRFVSDRLIGDDPERVKQEVRATVRRLIAEQDFDHLLFAHGDPLVGGGKEALRRFAS